MAAACGDTGGADTPALVGFAGVVVVEPLGPAAAPVQGTACASYFA
jgi:hypothetical protein